MAITWQKIAYDDEVLRLDGTNAMAADINMDSDYQVVALQAPAAAGEAIRQTAKITEVALEDAVDKKHDRSHSIVGTSDHSDVANFIDGPLSPGVLTGGIISEGTVGTVTVSAITALLRTGTATTDPLIYVSLAEQANKAIGSADTKYHVGLDYNSGAPQILVQTASFNRTTQIGLGTCMKDTSTPVRTHFANAGMRHQDGVSKLQRRASSLRRTELASGCAIGDVGAASRQFNIQKGVVYHGIYRMTPFDAAPYDPYISGDDGYFLVYGDTATGFTISDGTDTVISNTQYWDASAHALDNITVNQYGCFWVYIHTDDEDVYVVMGDSSSKLAEAEQAQPLTDLPIEISDFGLLLGCIIIERNATAFETIQMVTDTIFTGSAVADHGSLTGLEDDDHAQYLLVAGTRPMTGALDMGTYKINNVVDPGADQDAATKKYVDDNAGIPSYRIATGETLMIDDYKQLIIHDAYLIEGSGELTVDGVGELVVIGG